MKFSKFLYFSTLSDLASRILSAVNMIIGHRPRLTSTRTLHAILKLQMLQIEVNTTK